MRQDRPDDITAAIQLATQELRAYRLARQLYMLLSEEEYMTFLQPPGLPQVKEGEVLKPEEVGTIDHDLTIVKPTAPAKPDAQLPQKVQIRGMSSASSIIRKRLESVRGNMSGLSDDLTALDKTLSEMRGHVNATHEDIHSDATMLGNSAGNGAGSSQELADKLTGDT